MYLAAVLLLLLTLPPIQGYQEANLTDIYHTEYLESFTIISTYIPTLEMYMRKKRSYPDVRTEKCHNITIPIKSKSYTFCIFVEKLYESDIMKKDALITVQGLSSSSSFTLQDLNITIAYGTDLNNSINSVEGYVQDNRFYGRIYVDTNLYYVEPVKNFHNILKKVKTAHMKQAIMYDAKDAVFRAAFADEVSLDSFDMRDIMMNVDNQPQRALNVLQAEFGHRHSKGRVCELLLLADHIFLRDMRSVNNAVLFMLRAVEMANLIFRNTDFNDDGIPDNIGLSVKYIIVLQEGSPQNHLYVQGVDVEDTPIDGRDYLQRITSYSVLKRVCLGAAFTGRRYLSRALGLSFTASDEHSTKDKMLPQMGGVCERPIQPGHNLNVLAVTITSENGERVPELMTMLSFAHELGHSFGSSHDNKSQCGEFLMSPTSLSGDEPQHFSFSNCSKREMNRVLQDKAFCFKQDQRTFCGNVMSVLFASSSQPLARVCALLLLADYTFYHNNGDDISSTVIALLSPLLQVNAIFRVCDLDQDGLPDNVGFLVKDLVIFTSPDNLLSSHFNTSQDYLQQFSQFWLEEYCLSLAFTHRDFGDGTLGASWLANPYPLPPGGVCQKPVYLGESPMLHSFNTLMVSSRLRSGDTVPWPMIVTNLAHELGHAVGSLHDANNVAAKYIMAPFSSWGDGSNGARFSPASRRRMARVIQNKGSCLEDVQQAFCSNGLIEEGEECDCGLPMDCMKRDPCCIPRGRVGACHVDKGRGHVCHPSQGPCCLSTCQYRDLASIGLDCSQMQQRCPCNSNGTTCPCQLLGTCVNDACHSTECTRIGLEECVCHSSSSSHCETCCVTNQGRCRTVSDVTKQLVMDPTSNVTLDLFLKGADNADVTNICDNSRRCVDVQFRKSRPGGLCVSFGNLGKCSENGVCNVTAFLDDILDKMSQNSANGHISIWLWLLNLIVFVILFN